MVNRRRRINFSVAGSLLVLLWMTAPQGPPAGPPRSYAQTAPPDITGTYQGNFSQAVSCGSLPGSGSGKGPASVQILTQQDQSFTGAFELGAPKGTPPVTTFNGTVNASGQLSGTYSYQTSKGANGSGTFTGQITGNQMQASLTGTGTNPSGQTCNESVMIMVTGQTPPPDTSDLSITGIQSPSQAASGAQITYSLTINNAGPDSGAGVVVTFPSPAGTTIAAATTSQGEVQGAAAGSTGNVVFFLGTLASGAGATVSITINVIAPGGTDIIASASVVGNSNDPNLANNMIMISTPVVGGGIIELVWDQPAPTATDPTPAPENLRAVVVTPFRPATGSDPVTPQDSCTLVDINVYKSDQPDVQTIPSNLWETVPPNMLQTTMAAAPAGSFYVITNVWNCDGTLVESGPSNEASVPAGPTITKLKIGGKLKALGTGFSGPVQVLVDGVGFVKSAVIKSNTTVVQKGTLTDGTPIASIGATTSALISVVNDDGGIGTFAYKKP